ncbi:MAG TPA: hypothetical protein PLQ45_04180, partial [Anaerohalosphaeraceae bacterium]|nr:hypothetical protein [Anaerohalosphaeraceae bacterium]
MKPVDKHPSFQPPGEEPEIFSDQTEEDLSEELAGEHLCFRVGGSLKFRRLDKYLCGRFSHFSRTRLQKIIKGQGV